MNIKLWRVLLFVLIIIGTTVLIYPFPRDMVPLYLRSGEVSKAANLLSELLEEDPYDLRLLNLGVDVFLKMGMPDKAITSLEEILKQKPDRIPERRKLAQVYEWNVMPREAMHTWEKLSKIESGKMKPLEQLVMYYRYFDMFPQEVDAILKLNELQGKRPFSGDFMYVLNDEIERLGAEHAGNADDPYLNFLIQRIFIVGERFKAEIEFRKEAGGRVDFKQYVIYVLEYFVATDRIEGGYEYAARMDEKTGLDVESRTQLVKVLGWAGEYEQALEIADRLLKISPENVALLTETAWMARSADRHDIAQEVLEKLVQIEPDNHEHQQALGATYMATGNHRKAVSLFRRLAERVGNWLLYAHDMLRAALFSGDIKLMSEVVEHTRDVDLSEPEYLRTRGELLLTLERPREAYDALRRVVDSPGATLDDYERLIDAAGGTGEQQLLADTVDLALKAFPGDINLMRIAGSAWRNAGQPYKAYKIYRTLLKQEKLQQDIIDMLLAASETQDLKLAKQAAQYAENIAPKDVLVIAQAGEIMLWLNSPKDGYPYYKKAAIMTGGSREYVMNLIQIASYTGDKAIFRDAAETAIKLRPDDEQVALLAAAVWTAAGDNAKAELLLARFAGQGTKNLETLHKWADFADKAGLNEEAYRIYDELYERGYKRREIREPLARLAEWTGRPAVAAKIYGEISDESPRDFDLAKKAAKGWSDAGEYDKAVAYYERAIDLKPQDYELKLELARTYGFAGQPQDQIRIFKELQAAGKLPEAERVELARAYLDAREPEPALRILEPYARLKKLPRFEGFLLASALQMAGRGSEASDVYKRLKKEYNKDEVFLARLGAEALFNNFQTDAYGLFEAALKVNPENHTALKGLGIILGEREQYKRAAAKLRKYLKLVPDDAEGRYQLGEIYRFMGRENDAVRQFKRAARTIKREGRKNVQDRDLKRINR
ncbi:tetratricopeptide repeat protein [Desulfovibrio sp. JC010]|uniref:tetratricopeptide repeat protein n=1 Tax=Desulfovibrio sp. JC010 TaxID=2593641 RepID=UPI0013D32D2E|nr:tetratricopeptide repeat protein [Desulfovibrio sp. JC010]NDV26820.1 tetratricopeptide repeat protein [Desulfovibrio sp. JC010]